MNRLSDFVKSQPLGISFAITASQAGLTPIEFDSLARRSAKEGGKGFEVTSMQVEAQSPLKLVYIVFALRTPFDGENG